MIAKIKKSKIADGLVILGILFLWSIIAWHPILFLIPIYLGYRRGLFKKLYFVSHLRLFKKTNGSKDEVSRRGKERPDSLLKWLGKLIIVVIAILVFGNIFPILGIVFLIVGWIWLRKPNPPLVKDEGIVVLPRPFLWALFGHPRYFLEYCTVGRITRVGWKLGPLGEPQISMSVHDLTVKVDFIHFLFGVAKITIIDASGEEDVTYVGAWAADKMAEFLSGFLRIKGGSED